MKHLMIQLCHFIFQTPIGNSLWESDLGFGVFFTNTLHEGNFPLKLKGSSQ